MTSLIYFLHICFMRSYRYGPPTVVFMLGLIFVYSMVPNPVMDSYAFTTSFLFIVSASLCYSIIDIETPNQELVTVLHSGSLLKLYISKMLYSWGFTFPLTIFAVFYPAVFHKFDRNPTLEELFMAVGYHSAVAWLGVSLACWFTVKLFRSRLLSFLMLCLVITISFSAQGIENSLPEGWSKLSILLPPLQRSIYVLSHYDEIMFTMKISAIGVIFLYGTVLSLVFLIVMNKRKLDSPKT
ncbi:hypothetical protein [Paenibacillus crassostreae]|uniref:Uncharacterized protein n=1 Tax=Paenibacillus crassostreae TaxID=1763538 RepID=A0A167C0W7_9BACL|nr:hypothetical protein [Paenibacillus crassostreae]AOZ91779.1 hypothetical protein LPB68_05775 [Paenibacillus crassostreae]OAB72648.1 hypothetical protein PNBC_14475 [Paenibacillus crassostreae]